jgi:fructokinase
VRPLIFGEVLFDRFPDGRTVLGGAPLNVAWHLRRFGEQPLLVSRVGADELGDALLERLQAGGLDTDGIQVDAERPTGAVDVSIVDDEPQFLIPPTQAFDFIDPADVPAIEAVGVVYHGTLAARAPISAAALRSIRSSGLPTFIDVNLRAPWWDRGAVEGWLIGADWLKLNAFELLELGGGTAGRSLLERAQSLRRRFRLGAVVVTCGRQGSFVVTAEATAAERADRKPDDFIDAVGAGDAFSAVALLGLAHGWPLRLTLQRASAFAAAICAVRGAVPANDEPYERLRGDWGV